MANTPEYRAVSTSTGVLVEGIAVEIERYAEKFHDEELITDSEYNIALKSTTEVDDAHKGRRIVQNITAKIKAKPPLFIELLRVLSELGLTNQAEKLETKFLSFGGKLPKPNPGAESNIQPGSQERAGAESNIQPGRQERAEEKPYKDLKCSEIKKPKPKQQGFDYDEFCKCIKYITVVINDNEFNAATTVISSPEPGSDRLTNYQDSVYLGKIGQHPVGLIHCEPGRECATTLNEGVNYFPNAKFLIGAGVCYGFDYDKVKFGDVVISKRIEDFGPGKLDEKGIEIRGPHINMHSEIKEIFCTNPGVENEFPVASLLNFPDSVRFAKYYVGTVISHSFLLNYKDIKKKLQNASPSAYGAEMEGGELLKIQQEKQIQVILIKAVVDYGDGTKSKEWQFIGAQAAFNYVKCKMSTQSVSEVEQGRTTPSQHTGAGQNDNEIAARTFGAESTEGIVTGSKPVSSKVSIIAFSLKNIKNFLRMNGFPSSNADRLGEQLDEVPQPEIKTIIRSHGNSDWDSILTDILTYWLANDLDSSWAKLGKALYACGYKVAASKLGVQGSVDEVMQLNTATHQ